MYVKLTLEYQFLYLHVIPGFTILYVTMEFLYVKYVQMYSTGNTEIEPNFCRKLRTSELQQNYIGGYKKKCVFSSH